ncbi:MAG: LysE family translocator [Marinibacterium sp.]
MIDLVVLVAFVPAALALNLTPGADMMLCIAQAMKGGAPAGWRASAGVSTGGLIHGLVAGLGLAGLVAAYPPVFDAIRWVGAAYLLYLAWATLKGGGATGAQSPRRHAYWNGLIVNLTNPKVILFTLAFVPQFTDPTRALLPQFVILAAILSAGGFVVNGLAGAGAGVARARLGKPAGRWFARVSAAIFCRSGAAPCPDGARVMRGASPCGAGP